MNTNDLLVRLLALVPMLLSLSVHEWAHAFAAYQLGDTTAEEQGRLTLNPLAHIDPVGTLLFPLMGIPFGWAKPVPINPLRFRRDISMAKGMLITAAAGPFSNLVLAALCFAITGTLVKVSPGTLRANPAIALLLSHAMSLNLGLAIFNLLPIPPLDGSRIVEGVIPFGWRERWAKGGRYVGIAVAVIVGGWMMFGR